MSDAGFSLLWSKILNSSLWVEESKETRLVWITLLAMKDAEGNVFSSKVGLADRAKVSPEECEAALEVLLSPDPSDTSGVQEGRRIKPIAGGWNIINHDLYRFSTDAKREFWRQQKAEQRAKQGKPVRKKAPKGTPLPLERQYLAAEKRGDAAEMDRLAAAPMRVLQADGQPAEANPVNAVANPDGVGANEAVGEPEAEDWSFGGEAPAS